MRKSKKIQVRVTEEEHLLLHLMAAERGVSMSDLLRDNTLGVPMNGSGGPAQASEPAAVEPDVAESVLPPAFGWQPQGDD